MSAPSAQQKAPEWSPSKNGQHLCHCKTPSKHSYPPLIYPLSWSYSFRLHVIKPFCPEKLSCRSPRQARPTRLKGPSVSCCYLAICTFEKMRPKKIRTSQHSCRDRKLLIQRAFPRADSRRGGHLSVRPLCVQARVNIKTKQGFEACSYEPREHTLAHSRHPMLVANPASGKVDLPRSVPTSKIYTIYWK